MQPARQDPGRHPHIGPNRAFRGRRALRGDEVDSAPAPRRVEQAPALAMLLAPALGLVVWGLLIWGALVFIGY